MKFILIISFTLFLFKFTLAQSYSDWRNYTDLKIVNDIAVSSEGLWAATSGGAFSYKFTDNSFLEFRKANGLNGISLTAIAVDNYGQIWTGSNTGVIDIFNPSTNSFKTLLDIFNYEATNKQINNITVAGDTIIISTDFGISLINSENFFFYDTFSKLGTIATGTKVNNTYYNGLFYTATQSGIAIQKPGSTNLTAPESWNVFQTNSGLASNTVYKIIDFRNLIIAATDEGLSSFNGTMWEPFLAQLSGQIIKDIIVVNGMLYILANNSVLTYDSEISNIFNSPVDINKILYTNELGIVAASNNGIISITDPDNFILPNSPPSNQFTSLSIDNNSNLWAGSGRDPAGIGFYQYDGLQWVYYSVATAGLPTNSYFITYSAPNNDTYVGNWGRGFVKVYNDNLQIYGTNNTDMTGTDKNPDYLVVTGFAADSRNNIWILNFGTASNKILSMLTPDSSWYHFSVPAEQNRFFENHHGLVIDQYDTKWYHVNYTRGTGLYYFNENKTYNEDQTSDDRSGYLNTSSGLNDNTIKSLAVDRRGDIWVGTAFGVNVISNNSSILSSNPQLRITSAFPLRQQSINCIAVDPLNNKWIGTNQGLLYVNSDGTSLIQTLNTENSALLSNQITSIAIDENKGIVYVGTDNGLTSFKTVAVEPEESFTELSFYPSPFVLKSDNQLLTIDGLIRDTDIKVLTITGKLVKEFTSPGGRVASWDGKDSDGRVVNSGVYIIVAYDKEGNSVTSGKIAVLRE